MPERKSALAYAMLALVFVAGMFAQSTPSAHAADECLSKPNSPAPQGQHWYYRVDHANNRQCWRLGQEGLLVRKSAPQVEASAVPPTRAERPTTTPPTDVVENATDVDVAATAAPVPWLDGSKLLNLPPSLQPLPQARSGTESQFASVIEPAPPVSNNLSNSTSGDGSPASTRAEKSQRTAARPLHATVPVQTVAEGDHAFPLLMIMFASLAVAGVVLNYTKRLHKRRVRNFQAPRWASTIALNTPAVRAPLARAPEIAPALAPLTPPDQTERLRHALQQVVDQLQTIQRPGSKSVKYSASVGGH